MKPFEPFKTHTWDHTFWDRETTKREYLEHFGDLINVAIGRANADKKMIDDLT
jgi:hypothetical protein